jgi:hypothetical protein
VFPGECRAVMRGLQINYTIRFPHRGTACSLRGGG